MTSSTATPAIAATIALIKNCILRLKANCDGASSHDGAGFSKFDTQAGHDFAHRIQAGRLFSPKQFAYMGSLCVKYRGQLRGVDGWNEDAIKEFIASVKDGTFTDIAEQIQPAKQEAPATKPGSEFVETQGVFVKYSTSGAAMHVLFNGNRKEWIPCSQVHADDKLQQGVETVFRVPRWIVEQKNLPAPRVVAAPAPVAPRAIVTHVIE